MKLYYTDNSIYSRVVRVAIAELALQQRVTEVLSRLRTPENEVLADNPTGKVPTLVLDDGSVLSETRIICEYLEGLAGRRFVAALDDVAERQLEGIATGMLDGLAVWVRELRRPENERSPGILEQEIARARRCLAYFEASAAGRDQRVALGNVTLACATGTLDHHLPMSWRPDHPSLAAWADRLTARTSFVATAPG